MNNECKIVEEVAKTKMQNHLIEFKKIDWINAGIGVRFKAFINGNQQLTLLEFSEGFIEPEWCSHGHSGYVLDGEFSVDFNGNIERFVKGDICFIPSGLDDKHKAILCEGEKVLLLLFELI
jgi:quercetin dioxygenase-like cupin family protein